MDRRTSVEDNVLHTNTIISYNEPFNNKVIRVVTADTIIGHAIDFKTVSKENLVSIEKYSIPFGVIWGSKLRPTKLIKPLSFNSLHT